MSHTYASLAAAGDEFAFCDGVFKFLVNHYGEADDVAAWPAEHRTMYLVWHTAGVIADGAFNALFHTDLAGDTDFVLTQQAYEDIGCEPALAALRPVFHLFPDGVPPRDPMERLRLFVRGNKAADGHLNKDFFKTIDALTVAVAAYVRGHEGSFRAIEGSARPAALRRGSAAEAARKHDPVLSGLSRLPKWVRVAYAARCARLVLPLYRQRWPDAPDEFADSLDSAVRLAEMSAAEGGPMGDLLHASLHAGRAAIAAQDGADGVATEYSPPASPADATVAVLAANAARSAADTAAGKGEAVAAYGFANDAAEAADRPDLLEQMQVEYERVRDFARNYDWTDATPLSPEAFKADYEPSRKSWWKVW